MQEPLSGFVIHTQQGNFTLDELIRRFDRRPKKPAPPSNKPKTAKRLRSGRNIHDCPCGARVWRIIKDDPRYRDPFLRCMGCFAHFRMDRTKLELAYAWRDGIIMPEEIK